jgi:hypothetical protein
MKVLALIIFVTFSLCLLAFVSYTVQNDIEDRRGTYISYKNIAPGKGFERLFWFVQVNM